MKTFVISYDEAPHSINSGGAGSRRHWTAAHKEKVKWEGIYGMLLLSAKVPRRMANCKVKVVLEFVHPNRRDVENYRPAVSKPLADALVKGGWLEDDTEETFQIGHIEIIKRAMEHPNPQVKSRVTVTLEATYADDPD